MKQTALTFLLLLCLPCSLVNAQAGSQQQPARESGNLPTIKTTTRLVVVDVVATDNKGQPVRDLQQSDFTVLEDGKPQDIKIFSFQQSNGTAPATPQETAPQRQPGVFSNTPTYKPDGPVNVILLDWLNTPSLNQADARLSVLKVLDKLPPDRPVAIFILGTQLQLLQDFTTDPQVLRGVIREITSKRSPSLKNPTDDSPETVLPYQMTQHIPARMLAQIIQSETLFQSGQTSNRVALTISALHALAQALAGYPGRKNLIWLSESFPVIGSQQSEVAFDKRGFIGDYNAEVARISDELMSSHIAVYPIDVRGVYQSADVYRAGNDGHDEFGRPLTGNAMGENMSKNSDETMNARTTMTEVAERTGGRAFYNTNDFAKAILTSLDDGATYYTLGYYPENKTWDGKFRRIQVKTERHGLKLRYRLGYFASNPTVFEAESVQQKATELGEAVRPEAIISTAILFQAQVKPPSAETQNKMLVRFTIDPHTITFDVPEDGLYHAKFSCVAQVYTEKGKPVKTEGTSLSSALKQSDYERVMNSYVPCQLPVELPPGSYFMKLAVRDEHNGHVGTLAAQATVPGEQSAGTSKQ
jgi:VWFA-related protein